jgi:hypothetical protein
VPGRPERAGTSGAGDVTDRSAVALVAAVLAEWRPLLHRQPALGLVSTLDESRDGFRRRCLGLLRPLLLDRAAPAESVAERLAQLAAGIESRSLDLADAAVRVARVGLVWYPASREPAALPAELMARGAPRGTR